MPMVKPSRGVLSVLQCPGIPQDGMRGTCPAAASASGTASVHTSLKRYVRGC